jgi:hypothetical protein
MGKKIRKFSEETIGHKKARSADPRQLVQSGRCIRVFHFPGQLANVANIQSRSADDAVV